MRSQPVSLPGPLPTPSRGGPQLRPWLVVVAIVVVGCGGSGKDAGSPDTGALGGDAAAGTAADTAAKPGPIQLDFLWVIDHSPSMCQEQRSLANALSSFIATLRTFGPMDIQMAVVTIQQVPDKVDIKVVGRFMHRAATIFPPNCFGRVIMPCQSNADCSGTHTTSYPVTSDTCMCNDTVWTNPYVGGTWECHSPGSSKLLSNVNCSVNGSCVAKCTSDSECRAIFEADVPASKQRSICKYIAGQQGCMFPPPTAACPPSDKLPDVATDANLDSFHCNTTMGAASTQEASFEGAFRSAWTALDPAGPNCDYDACVKALRTCCAETDRETWCSTTKAPSCTPDWCEKDFDQTKCDADTATWCAPLKDKKNCQHTKLLRDDAYLVLMFMSNNDECSMHMNLNPLDKTVILREVWHRCGSFGDSVGSNEALSAGNCEYRRGKNPDVYCHSDCEPGVKFEDQAGVLKCPAGCKAGSAEHEACLAKAAVDTETYKKIAFQFAPVAEFVTRFKSLKSDPAKVIVATIAGDSLASADGTVDGCSKERDRVNYYHSMLRDQGPGQVPYVCRSNQHGEQELGWRYIELAQAFGDHGIFSNVCNEGAYGPDLQAIAASIGQLVSK